MRTVTMCPNVCSSWFPILWVDTILKWTVLENILIESQDVLEQLAHGNDACDLSLSGGQS